MANGGLEDAVPKWEYDACVRAWFKPLAEEWDYPAMDVYNDPPALPFHAIISHQNMRANVMDDEYKATAYDADGKFMQVNVNGGSATFPRPPASGVMFSADDPRSIPLTSEEQEMMDAINRDYMDDLIMAQRRYEDEQQAIKRDFEEKLQALFLETATMSPTEFAAWRQERSS